MLSLVTLNSGAELVLRWSSGLGMVQVSVITFVQELQLNLMDERSTFPSTGLRRGRELLEVYSNRVHAKPGTLWIQNLTQPLYLTQPQSHHYEPL